MGDTNTEKLPTPEEILGSTDGEALPSPEEILGTDAKKKTSSAPLPSVSGLKFDQLIQPEMPGSVSESLLEDGISKSNPVLVTAPTKTVDTTGVSEGNVLQTTGTSDQTINPTLYSPEPLKTIEKQKIIDKNLLAQQPTSKEKKQELESSIGEAGMVSNRPQEPDVTTGINYSETELKDFNDLTGIVTNGHPENHYGSLVMDYLKDQYKNDPEAYHENAYKIRLGMDESEKNKIVQLALNNNYQILEKDQSILDARGAQKDFTEFGKIQEQANTLNQEYNIQGAFNMQDKIKHAQTLSNHYLLQYKSTNDINDLNEANKYGAERDQLISQYQVAFPEDKMKEYHDKFDPLLQQEQSLLEDPNKSKNIEDYHQLITDGVKLSQASVDYVKNYPSVVKQLKDQEEINQYVKDNPILSLPGEVTKNAWNGVVDFGAKALEFIEGGRLDGSLLDFTQKHLEWSVSNIPVTNEDGTINYSRILPMLSHSAADIAMLAVGGGVVSKVLQEGVAMSEATANGMGLFTSSFVQSYPDYKKMAMDKGWSESDASLFALALAGSTSSLWAIAPNQIKGFIGDIATKVGEKELAGLTAEELKTLSKDKILELAKNTFTKLFNSKDIATNTGLMFGQKMLDNTAGFFANKLNTSEKAQFQENMTKRDVVETLLMGITTSVLMSGAHHWGQDKTATRNSALMNAAKNYDSFREFAAKALIDGTYSKEKIDQMIKDVDQAVFAIAKMPTNMTEAKKESVLPLLVKKLKIVEEKKGSDKAFHEKFDRQIEAVDAEIKEVLKTKIDKPVENIMGDNLKTDTNASENIERLPSEVGIGEQKLEQTGIEQKTGVEEIKTSGVVQSTPEGEVLKKAKEEANYSFDQLINMSPEELKKAADKESGIDKNRYKDVFGKESATYKKLEAIVDSRIASKEAKNNARLQMDEMENKLTEEQKGILFGSGYKSYVSHQELSVLAENADLFSADNLKDQSDQYLFDNIGRELTTGEPTTDPKSAIVLKGAYEEAKRRGYSNEDILLKAINERIKGGEKKNDLIELAKIKLNKIINPVKETTPHVKELPAENKKATEEPEMKVHKLAERWIDSTTLPEEMKEGMKKMGIKYIPKGQDVTLKQAKEIVKLHEQADNLEGLETMARDPRNEMEPDTRAVVLAELNQKYVSLSHEAVDAQTKEFYRNKAIDIALYAAKDLTLAGRKINNAGKIWKRYLRSEPEGANIALQKEYNNLNEPSLKGKEKTITDAKKVIEEFLKSPEFEKLVGEKVKEQLKSASGNKNIFNRTASERKAKIAELKDRWKNVGPKLTSGGLDSERIEIAVELGAEYLALGVTSFAKWSKNMMADLGITPEQAKDLWQNQKVSKDIDPKERTLAEFSNYVDKKKEYEITPEQRQAVKDKFIANLEGKLEGLTSDQQKKLLGDSFNEYMKSGKLDEYQFKQLFAKALGLKYIDEGTANALRKLQERIIAADKAADKYLEEPTDANAKILKKSMYDARLANSEMSKYFSKKNNAFDLTAAFIQGNLLTTTSSAQNVVYNINRAPTTVLINASSSAVDYLLSKAAKILSIEKLKGRTIDYAEAIKGYFPGFFSGGKEGAKQLKTGALADDYHAREMQAGLHPLDAMARFWGGLTKKERQTYGQQFMNLYEGVLGIAPETMFRILNLGDKPFRRGAENARLSEIVGIKLKERKEALLKKEKSQGLTESEKQLLDDIKSGAERKKQMLVPDEDTLEVIEKAGLMATYQNENPIYKWLKTFSRVTGLQEAGEKLKNSSPFAGKMAEAIGGILKVFKTTQAPYINTPLNIGVDIALLTNPALATTVGIGAAIGGDRRTSIKMFSTAMIGYTVAKAAQYLISANVITPTDKDDDKKTRDFKRSQGILPNRFNWSLYQRLLAGKPNDGWKPEDFTFDYSNSGIIGAMFQVHAEMAKQYSDEQKQSMGFFENQGKLLNASAKSMFDKSFFAGTNTLINSWTQGGDAADKWLVQTSNALKAMWIPNTVAKVSNINNEFMREVRDKSTWQTIKNNFKNQLFMGADLPRKVTPWGDYIKTTPDDRSAMMYQLFDFSKGSKIPEGSFGEQIYKLWKKTESQYVIPSAVDNKITVGNEKIELSPKEYEELQVNVGQSRKSLAKWYMTTPDWEKADDESKIKALQNIYTQGYNVGLAKYKADNGLDIKTKKRRAKYEVNRSAIKNKAAKLEKQQ